MEGKKKYIAIVLFLLIGLTIFTFANPVEEKDLKKEGKDGNSKTEVVEKEDKDKTDDTSNSSTDSTDTTTNNTIPVANTNNGGTGLTGNSGSNQEDNGYAKALAAVQVAESSLKANDVATAKDLVSKVTDQNQKTELTERINVVEEAIKAIELVDQLEKLVNESTSLSEMNIARDYRDNEEIVAIVSALKNTAVKETLTNRLNTLAKVLDDNNQPVITGIENNEITKEDVTLTVEDDNEVTITVTLNGSEIAYQDIFKEEGVYTVTALDAAFNSQTITFTIDKTAPTATLSMRTTEPTNKNLIVTLKTSEAIKTPKGWTKVSDTIYTKKYTRNTTEEVEIEDLAGNKSTVKIEITNIDKIAPVATITKSNNDKATNEDVIVTLTTNETILTPAGWTEVANSNGTEFTKVYSENGKYEVTVVDKAGNETLVKFEVKRIDKVAPVVEVTKSNNDKSTNEDVVVTIKANEAVYKPAGWTEVTTNKEHEFTKVYSENGKYEVTVVDKAGNETLVKFEVKRIDKEAPILTVISPNKYQLEVGSEYVDKGYSAYDTVDKDVTNLIKITYQFQAKGTSTWPFVDTLDTNKLGTYKVIYTAYDKAGNMTKGTRVVQIVDTTSPLLTLNGDKNITLEAGVDTYEEKGATAVDNYDGLIENIQPAFINYTDANKNLSKVTTVDTTKVGTYKIVYKYTDSSDNEGVDANRNDHNYVMRIVVVQDTINPTITVKAESIGTDPYYSSISFSLSDSNKIDYFEVNGTKFDRTDTKYSDANYQNIKSVLNAGENTITLYDTVGNKTEKKFYMDWTAPTITAHSFIGTEPNYSGMSFQLSDNYLIDYFEVNGTKYDRTNSKYSDANYQNIKSSLVNGENTLVLYDVAGNSSSYKFTLERIAPTITVADGTVGTGPYSKLNLKLYDASGIASVVINGTKLSHTGIYVDINDGHAYTFQQGTNTVTVTDNSGNVTTQTFEIDRNLDSTTTIEN